MGRLNDKVALVTGAGQGIGEAIARAFAREGAQVVVAERNVDTGAAVAAAVGGLFIGTDVTVQAEVEAAVRGAEIRFGRVDVLVNNAGANVFHRPDEMPRSEWAHCMALDLEAAWAMAEAVLPGMRARHRGAIINIASCQPMHLPAPRSITCAPPPKASRRGREHVLECWKAQRPERSAYYFVDNSPVGTRHYSCRHSNG